MCGASSTSSALARPSYCLLVAELLLISVCGQISEVLNDFSHTTGTQWKKIVLLLLWRKLLLLQVSQNTATVIASRHYYVLLAFHNDVLLQFAGPKCEYFQVTSSAPVLLFLDYPCRI